MEAAQNIRTTSSVTQPGVQLERLKGLSYDEFIRRYVIPRKPVILEDAISDWPALRKWTPEFWIQRYNDRRVEIDAQTYCLGDVIRLALEPDPKNPPPYFRGVRIGHEYPELSEDLRPYPKLCGPNWFLSPIFKPLKRSSSMACGEYELFIGGAGRSFPFLHYDFPKAHTFIHQLQGQKLFIMFAPSDTPYIYPKAGRHFQVSRIPDVEHVSKDEFPLFTRATRIDAVLESGDTLFMPPGWWHTAKMLSFSVTVGIDVANETNWPEVADFLATKAQGRLGPIGSVFNSYIRLGAAYLGRTARVRTWSRN